MPINSLNGSSGGGGGIKSIQHLYGGLGWQSTGANWTITAVDTSKTFLAWCGSRGQQSPHQYSDGAVAAQLTSSTNVLVQRTGNFADCFVSLQVVEYY